MAISSIWMSRYGMQLQSGKTCASCLYSLLYRFEGYHADLNETYYVGDKARTNPDIVRLVETTRQCLDLAIAHAKPGVAFKEFGDVIEKHAKSQGLGVVKTYCGHGVNTLFHCAPNVPHYAKNKAVGRLRPGMTFTIEPMVSVQS